MIRLSTTMRLSLGLALLTLSVVLAADSIGLIPSRSEMIFEGRRKFCESLAVQCAVSAEEEDIAAIQAVVQLIVKRNDDIRSAAIRTADGKILAEAGSHQDNWRETSEDQQSLMQAQAPIFKGRRPWGTLEVRFNEIGQEGAFGALGRPSVKLVLFVVLGGLVATLFFLRKTLRHVAPTSVVPSRVKTALDSLTEGVILVDKHERIVLANSAFAETVGRAAAALLGRKASDLRWVEPGTEEPARSLPWTRSLQEGETQAAVPLAFSRGAEDVRSFVVNSAAILDAQGAKRGALVTFADVTELEDRNAQLQEMLNQLEASHNEVRRQNSELRTLATRDPLTGCLNRRSLFDKVEADLAAARRHGHEVSCVMVDIDGFKAVNDQHGHTTGDRVLQHVADALQSAARTSDIVCRYGGEEFCIVLPYTSLEMAAQAAERFRLGVESLDYAGVRVTASFGVSCTGRGSIEVEELICRADKALYVAKNSGGNKVTCWDGLPAAAGWTERGASVATPGAKVSHRQISFRAVKSLLFALAHRDVGTAEHCRQVADLCVATAKKLMSAQECFVLEAAAQLHDIGKLGVPDSILLKPGPLSDEELKVMHDHLRRGVEIVSAAFSSSQLNEIVRHNHTWFGGDERAPHLPKGRDIPLGARILAIADAYSAMVCHKPYRGAHGCREAFEELRRCAGEQFDPELVERFIETVSARDEYRSATMQGISDAAKLEIGQEVERIASALNDSDFTRLSVTANRLAAMATKQGVARIAELASGIEKAATDGSDLAKMVQLTTDLMDACRALSGRELEAARVG